MYVCLCVYIYIYIHLYIYIYIHTHTCQDVAAPLAVLRLLQPYTSLEFKTVLGMLAAEKHR